LFRSKASFTSRACRGSNSAEWVESFLTQPLNLTVSRQPHPTAAPVLLNLRSISVHNQRPKPRASKRIKIRLLQPYSYFAQSGAQCILAPSFRPADDFFHQLAVFQEVETRRPPVVDFRPVGYRFDISISVGGILAIPRQDRTIGQRRK